MRRRQKRQCAKIVPALANGPDARVLDMEWEQSSRILDLSDEPRDLDATAYRGRRPAPFKEQKGEGRPRIKRERERGQRQYFQEQQVGAENRGGVHTSPTQRLRRAPKRRRACV